MLLDTMSKMRGARMISSDERDLAPDLLDERGRLRVMPASYYESTTQGERSLFCVKHGVYLLPTTELVDRLRELIGGRDAIEIGAGNGVVAESLGIPATDSYQQTMARYRAVYEASGQAPVEYGSNVRRMDAHSAVASYRPGVVLGCWVTHKYSPLRPGAGGNEAGVDEGWLVSHAEYLFVGNEQVHAAKAIWGRPHTIEYPPYLYSRAMNDSPDFIAVWPRGAL